VRSKIPGVWKAFDGFAEIDAKFRQAMDLDGVLRR
jgi:hypothetical protein